MIVRVIDWSKASLTRYHNNLSWPTFRHLQSEGTRWSDNKSLPAIISHDGQHKISPHHWRGEQSFWYYIYKSSHKGEDKFWEILSKRSTDLSLSLTMADKTIGGCVRTPRPDAFCRWDDWIKNLYWLRSCVHPFGNYVDHQQREASTNMIPFRLRNLHS